MDISTPKGSVVFIVMAVLVQMALEIKRERITDSVAERRATGKDLMTHITAKLTSADPG